RPSTHLTSPSFPTRRSSDLIVTYFNTDPFSTSRQASGANASALNRTEYDPVGEDAGTEDTYDIEQPDRDFPLHGLGVPSAPMNGDRKSTRLNSSHSQISYAV